MRKILLLLCCLLGIIGVQAQSYPSTLFLIGNLNDWNTSTSLSPTSQSNGVFTWDSVELKADVNSTDSYFSFVTVQANNWDSVNSNPRYGAKNNDETITSTATIINSQNAWKATAGTYKIVADFTSMTLTITLLDDGNEGGNQGGDEGNQGGGGNEGGDEGDDTLGDYYVLFNNTSNWGQPCVHAWDGDVNCTVKGEWPGDPMTQRADGLWYWKLPEGKSVPANIIFNNNNNGSQTGDLAFRNKATYDASGAYTGGEYIPILSDVEPSGTLPVLYINVYTDANKTDLQYEIIDKDLAHKDYFSDAEYWLDVNGCQWLIDLGAESVGSEDAPLPIEIKARGNFTRKGYSKKPFKLKLGTKQNLLKINAAGKKSKHWAILAHADDSYGYMRNFVGFRLGEMIGLPWTPRQQPIEVVINGDYRGIYFLTESIRVEDGRVPITELDDEVSDPALISGGYLVELDNYYDDCTFAYKDQSNYNQYEHYGDLMVTADTPEVLSDLQLRFLKEQFEKMNNLVNSSDDSELWSYMDLDDAARYYVIEEILSHYEAYHGSTYLFRDHGEGQKWHFSPLWDCGHAFDGPTDRFFADLGQADGAYGNNWIGNNSDTGLRSKTKFMEKVRNSFQWFVNKATDGSASPYEQLCKEIDDYVAHIKEAALQDAKRWKDQPLPVKIDDDPKAVIDNSDIEDDKAAVKSHLDKKINWLKDKWGSAALDEPERDTTEAAPLPDYAQAGYVPETHELYVIDDDNWGNVNMWLYTDESDYSDKWPGPAMEFDADITVNGVKGVYHFTVPNKYINGLVIFSNNGNNQYPSGNNVPGKALDGKDRVFYTGSKAWAEPESVELPHPWSGRLPLVRITTPDNAEIGYGDEGAVKKSTFELDDLGIEGVVPVTSSENVTIKGRSRSYWDTYDKKAYKLKFGSKVALLGMPKSKHWVLMPYANDAANGLLANYVGHELSRLIGLEWTPSMEPVEVVLNGEYIGLYFIAENVRAAAERVQIADYGDDTYSEANDFLLEITSTNEDDGTELFHSWTSADGFENKLITTTPALEDIATEEEVTRIKEYLAGHIDDLNATIDYAARNRFSLNWTDVIDHEQAAKYYVVQELMDDLTSFTDNFYIHHTTDSRWMFGPVWDFANAFSSKENKQHLIHENDGYQGTFIKDLYNNRMFVWFTGTTFVKFVNGSSSNLNPNYSRARSADAQATYNPTIPGSLEDVYSSIDAMTSRLEDAAECDAVAWPQYAATEAGNSLTQRAENVKYYLQQNQAYLAASTTEGGAGWNDDDIATGVDDIIIDINNGDTAPRYYDVMGREVTNPQAGSVYIIRRVDKVTKEIAR